ncbi:lysyl-tRNA synthetase domain protein, partial [Chlamydia psittaci 02DC21]
IKPNFTSQELIDQYDKLSREEIESKNVNVILNGRVIAQRGPFIVLQDKNATIQAYINKTGDVLDANSLEVIKQLDL